MPDLEYFIDGHCHLFTIADIPLYKPLQQVVADKDSLGTFTLLSLMIFARPFIDPKKSLEHYKPYITYFEAEPKENVYRLSQEIFDAVGAGGRSPAGVRANAIVLTPLIMDFDLGAEVNKLRCQADRLKAAVLVNDKKQLKILPFMGIHPGRSRAEISSLLHDYNVVSVNKRGGIDNTKNGDFIGIKLYPPLGFDAYPDDDPLKKKAYLDVYKEFADRGLPITVHCQKSSFNLTSYVDEYTQPQNWELVMKEQPELRINFAHFGGEDGIKNCIWFEQEDGNALNFFDHKYKKYVESSWTSSIIRMLKTYPNTYADLSAFDVSDEQALAALHWLLYLDNRKTFDKGLPSYKLEDKLLWGSDYPMIVNRDMGDYSTVLKKFVSAFHFEGRTIGSYEYPPKSESGARELFLKKICCDNPKKFLFG